MTMTEKEDVFGAQPFGSLVLAGISAHPLLAGEENISPGGNSKTEARCLCADILTQPQSLQAKLLSQHMVSH